MPNNKILPLIGCFLVLSGGAADYGLGKMDVPKPHRLPIETFPANLGNWKGGPLSDVDPDIQKALPTAKIVERVYTNPLGQQIDLMLLTATEDEDMHSPQACFPSQGWKLSNIQTTQVGSDTATHMTAESEGAKDTVLYWLTGYYPPVPPPNAFLRKVYAVRERLFDRHKNSSLFVRVIMPYNPNNESALTDFVAALHQPLKVLTDSGMLRSQSHVPVVKF